jgi:hypothetical protein
MPNNHHYSLLLLLLELAMLRGQLTKGISFQPANVQPAD